MQELLVRLNIPGFDANKYFDDHKSNDSSLPNIAIAVSGGGYRACLNGAGAIQAFDNRESNSTAPGHLGGLLQAATYFSGLSGGGWLVGSIFVNNFTTVSALQTDNTSTVWEFGNSIFVGPDTNGIQVLSSAQYYNAIYDQVQGKRDSLSFDTSVTDYWGRALSFQLINATNGGPNYTWSSIALDDNFANGQTPLPLLVADARAPGELLVSSNATVYEFSPWEFGTFDPTTYGFAPLEFLGSNFTNGVLPADQQCVRGFDNAGYVMGTSSSLFNQFLLQVNESSIPTAFKTIANKILTNLGQANNDIAAYHPNPFYGFHNSTSRNAQTKNLTLVDGGEDLQNIPLHPLIQPIRNVDVIFAVDSSADTTYHWPNGTSLVATYERGRDPSGIANGTIFPSIPDQNTFVNLGLNSRPTFFGCDEKNLSATSPLLVYMPNTPYVYFSNVSTFTPSYNNSERDAIVQNGYQVATMGNGTADGGWGVCVACAVLKRSLVRTGTPVPDACRGCFQRYCWDGTVNSTRPAEFEPKIKGTPVNVQSRGARMGVGMGWMGFVVVVTVVCSGWVLV